MLSLDPRSHVDGKIIRDGYYEHSVLDAVIQWLPDGGVFWDVGANIGLHSLTVGKLRPDATVVSFEPSPDVYASLAENASLNSASPVLVALPLSDTTGVASFSISSDCNAGLGSLVPWPDAVYKQQVPVWCVRAEDAIAKGIPAPAVIKIDVEGAELLVLRGLGEAVRQVRAIIFESAQVSEEDKERRRLIWNLLESNGFQIHLLEPSIPGDPVNYLAARNSA